MKISHKITIIIVIVSILILMLSNFLFGYFFDRYLLNQESEQTVSNVQNVISHIQTIKDKYSSWAADRGNWDDTNNFVLYGNRDYVKNNLQIATFEDIGTNIFVIFDSENKPKLKLYADLTNSKFKSFPEDLMLEINKKMKVYSKSKSSFLINVEGKTYFIAFNEITDSLEKQKPVGTIVVGSFLGDSYIKELETITQSEISFIPYNSSNFESRNRDIKFLNKSRYFVDVLQNEGVISVSISINIFSDLKSSTSILLLKDRTIYKAGVAQLGIVQWIYFFLMIFIVLLLIFFLRKYISVPIRRIVKSLKSQDFASNVFERLPENKNDEITDISVSINEMFSKIEDQNEKYLAVRRRLHSTREMGKIGSWEMFPDRNLFFGSQEMFEILGLKHDKYSLPMNEVREIVLPEYLEVYDKALNDLIIENIPYDVVYEIQNKETGNYEYLHSKAENVFDKDGKASRIIGIMQDITEKILAEKEIEYLIYHDQLTRQYNRRFFEEKLLKLDTPEFLPLGLVMIDVNGLKLTNDAFGHKSGDELLITIGEIVNSECGSKDILSRIGGDEFVILMPNSVEGRVLQTVNSINDSILRKGTNVATLSVSIGYSIKVNESEMIQEVFKKAEDDMYRHKLSASSSMRSKTIELIMNTLYEKSSREMNHSKRVADLCEALAGKLEMRKDQIDDIKTAGLMHDIGKIGIDENVLNKEGKLSEIEWKEIKRHPEVGYRILSSVNEFSEIAEYVLSHHERIDGNGYPRGVEGGKISVQSRIIAITDSYDAMTSDRPYRNALSLSEAVKELFKNSGTQFDPEIAEIFVEEVLNQKWPSN